MQKDFELCLEVQVDPASKKILSNPHKCNSELLDVTVVKPKELEAFGTQKTNTLRAHQVRKLLSSMERQRREKQKLIDDLKFDDAIIQIRKHEDKPVPSKQINTKSKNRISSNTPVDDLEKKDFIGIAESVEPLFCEIRRSLKNVETRITNMQDINLVISHTTLEETSTDDFVYRRRKTASSVIPGDHLKNSSIYRADKAAHDLKSVLRCKNKDKLYEAEKIEGKCICENCGIIGLLTECQKHPLLTELRESSPPPQLLPPLTRKKTRFTERQVGNPDFEQLACINQLSKRVKYLEERLAMQEERAVPKEYFKKIISRMVNNFTPKMFKSKSDISVYVADMKNQKKNLYQKCKEEEVKKPLFSNKTFRCQSSEAINCFHSSIHSNPKTPERRTINIRTDKSTITDEDIYYTGNIWRWGEEILRPGIDLKNRIVTLLTEILSKFAIAEKSIEKPLKSSFVDSRREFSKSNNSEGPTKFMDHSNPRVYNAQISVAKEGVIDLNEAKVDGYSFRKERIVAEKYRGNSEANKNIDVSYVNPKLSTWPKTFHGRFKDKPPLMNKRESNGKQEFLRIISKAKTPQKEALWRNIWTQAEANGQTKDDKITIKIPIPGKGGELSNEMFETELTIKEVEEVLTKNL